MKRLLILLISAGIFSSCEDYDIADQGFDLTELPGYVAFDAPGTNVDEAVEDTDEDAGSVEFVIETPTGSLTDVTIQYVFGGDAVFGTDFTVDGATASGGSIVLAVDPEDFINLDNVTMTIDLLTDGVADGDKVLTVELVSAVNAGGETLAVGRGGTGFLKTATVNIADVD
ncbi:hypothetical protein [Fulvivirga lutimaris]|uniref:hypothetical protein n=1 Tax=Fulvivirga lutimaris TaxID=1819566 RepID=UPI0012BB7031|nr:hypothetical protein [Fulvivirga lutimaris]MTI41644.1 hypothetical protein [Fulvivirga lutimaris]